MNFNNDFNNNKQNNFVSDNLKKYYEKAKKNIKIANTLFPTMKDKRDSIEDEIEQWEKSQSYIPKTNQTDNESIKIPKEETEREQMTRIAKTLYPTMKDKDEPEENKKSLDNSTDLSYTKKRNDNPIDKISFNLNNKPLDIFSDKSKKHENKENNQKEERPLKEILDEEETPKLKGYVSKTEYIDEDKENKKEKNNELKTKAWEYGIRATKYPIIERFMSILGSDVAGMLNIAEGKSVPIYTKDARKVSNVYDINSKVQDSESLSKWQLYMEEKIKKQFKDFNYNPKDIEGYFFKDNSAVVKRIKDSEEFNEIIKNNKDKIKEGEKFDGTFSKNKNLHNAFNNVDFLTGGADKNGDLHLYMFDTYDFNKNGTPKIEAGRRLMKNGELKGFFTIHDIIIKKEDLPKYDLQTKGK